jgi:hypothetical protein
VLRCGRLRTRPRNKTDVSKCATTIAVGGPHRSKSCNSKGPTLTITTMRRLGGRERIRTRRRPDADIELAGSAGLGSLVVARMTRALRSRSMKSLEPSRLWCGRRVPYRIERGRGGRWRVVDPARERAPRKLALLRLRASNKIFQGSAPSFVSGRNGTSAVPPVCELHSNGLA